jgi:hypothetical protein
LNAVGDSEGAKVWWAQRRLRFNIGLMVAGLLAFVAYVAAVDRGISQGKMPGAEITLFTTAFQAFGYLLMMAIANLCYNLGPWSESIIRPTDVETLSPRDVLATLLVFGTAPVRHSCAGRVVVHIHRGTTPMPEP